MILIIAIAAAFGGACAVADPINGNFSTKSIKNWQKLALRTRAGFTRAPWKIASYFADPASTAYTVLDSNFLNFTTAFPSENETWIDGCELELDPPEEYGIAEKVFLVIIIGMLIAVMIVGNILVILAILMERELQRAQYYLVLSLAMADLMVGVVVSPLAATYDINRRWHLGVPMCDFWILSDVLACTASILHLVAIALDRYWSITDVSYMQKRTARRICYMIMVVWAISFCVSVAPMMGWKDSQFHCRVEVRNECLISQDPSYQIFSTTTAFYGPLVLICILYWKIYKAAKKRIQMQVKRRSNTTVAQVRAKIMALQLQQSIQEQPGSVAGVDALDSPDAMQHANNNGHAILINGRVPRVKEQPQQKRSNVQICLIQPSNNEPSVEAEPLAAGKNGLDIRAENSGYSLSNADDDSREEATVFPPTYPKEIDPTLSTPVSNLISSITSPNSVTISNISATNCNGVAPRKCCPTDGGCIFTGADGSIDFSTEDKTEYIDDWRSPSPLEIDRKRSVTLPPVSVVAKASVTSSPAAVSESRVARPSTFSQSEYTSTMFTDAVTTTGMSTGNSQKKRRFRSKKESTESNRERRAGRTLAIITGIFVVSWLPFFILALIRPLCGSACAIPRPVDSVFVWLGCLGIALLTFLTRLTWEGSPIKRYVNSAVNPVIYTIFSPDFRSAFKRTLQRFCIVR